MAADGAVLVHQQLSPSRNHSTLYQTLQDIPWCDLVLSEDVNGVKSCDRNVLV